MVPVLLFHAGFEAFGGGFVGVDVFFVISGCLITSILLSELGDGTFSIVRFYERRARRILPALFLVMLVCVPLGWLWLVPHDMQDLSASLASVPLFVSNVLFWKTSGYFDTPTDLKPLIHTWSLAVEEQYYLVFPLLLLLAWRLGRRWVPWLMATGFVVSLAIAQWAVMNKPSAAFYLLPARGWELLVGGFAAWHLHRESTGRVSRTVSEAGAALGVGLILYSVFAFGPQTPFPGLHALVPTAGALLIILCARADTGVGRLLGSPLPVGIGLLSYSLYLWHQPVLAFARHRGLDVEGGVASSLLLALCLLLAYLSWRFVEKPFRDPRRVSRGRVLSFGVAASMGFMAIGLAGILSQGFEFRYTSAQREVLRFADYDISRVYRQHECFLESEGVPGDFAADCAGPAAAGGATLLWGDSYAAALSHGLRGVDDQLAQYTASVCPPVLDEAFSERPNCRAINDFIGEQVRRLQPGTVLLHANWHGYKRQDVVGGLEKTLRFLRQEAPDSRIFIVGTVPNWSPSLPIHALRKRAVLDAEHHLPVAEPEALAEIDARLATLARTHGAVFLSPRTLLCRDEQCLAITEYDGRYQLTAFDSGHLTAAGSMRLAEPLRAGYVQRESKSHH